MAKSQANIYINEKVKELLDKAEAFERRVLSDREEFFQSQVAVQSAKKANPDAKYTDVRENLITMQKTHYNSFLLEQNLQHVLNTLIEMNNMAIVLDIELDLNDDQRKALDIIGKSSTNLFTLDKEKNVVFADNELRPVVEKEMNDKQNDPKTLESMFAGIPAAQ
jgi:hypothetical protein